MRRVTKSSNCCVPISSSSASATEWESFEIELPYENVV
jgi:hypothetical protein